MRAMVYTAAGGPDVIALRDVPTPTVAAGQILVRVHAGGLNRADLLQRRGSYAAPPGWPADIPGLEYAGEVEARGDDVSRWQVGDRVMGLVGGGAHAEYVVVHEQETMPVPPGMSMSQAAAIPESFLTAYDALVVHGRLGPGERVLLHAAGSGLGTAAIQIAKQLGATVLGTSRTAGKLERARELGMDVALDTATRPFGEQLDAPVDVIVDVLGGPAFGANLEALAPRGRLVLLGFLQGPAFDGSLAPILRKRLEVIGSVMRARGLKERIPLVREFSETTLPLFSGAAPSLRPVVSEVFPMDRLADAHRRMEGNQGFGKIVLEVDGGR